MTYSYNIISIIKIILEKYFQAKILFVFYINLKILYNSFVTFSITQ